MIKNFYKITIVLLAICIAVSCENNGYDKPQTQKGKAGLTYWCASNPQELKLAQELVKEWNQRHPEIPVKLQPLPASQSSEEVLLAAIAGKTTPDVCSNMWPGAMDEFIAAGGLVRLDTFPDFWPYLSERVAEDQLKSFQARDGGYYQIPWKTNPIMVFYNKKIFKRAGVKAPLETYSQFLAAAEKIVRDFNGDGQVDYWMLYRNIKPIWWQRLFDYYPFYICASGGLTLFKGDEIIFNNEASIKVFQFFKTMYKRGFMPVTEFQGDQFLAGRLATQISGPWFVAHIQKFAPKGFEYGIMPIPRPDDYQGAVYTYGDPKNISIFNTTRYPREAWQFVKWLITRKADRRLLEICDQIPMRKNLLNDSTFAAYFKQKPQMKIFASQAPLTRGVDGVADLKEIFNAISQEYEASVIYDRRSAQEAVKRAAKRVKVIREWNR